MFKKITAPIILLAFTAGLSTAYAADPLQDFKAGTWTGRYVSNNCGTSYNGTATLVVANPIYYGNDSGGPTSVAFVGSLTLNGPLPSGYSNFSQPVALQSGTSIVHAGAAYSTFLYPDPEKGPAFSYMGFGYDPNTQEIMASGAGSCFITIDVFPAS